jgi:hypothetical protein
MGFPPFLFLSFLASFIYAFGSYVFVSSAFSSGFTSVALYNLACGFSTTF